MGSGRLSTENYRAANSTEVDFSLPAAGGYYLNLANLSVIKGREALPKPLWDQRHDLGILGLWYLGQYWCSQGELLVFQVGI